MIAIITSWIAMLVVFLSFGDTLVYFYNRFCKQNEVYGFTDTFLLGMCSVLIPLSISSLWLPSNQFILLAFVLLSIIYWCVRKDRFYKIVRHIKSEIDNLSILQIFLFTIPVVCLIIVIIWQVGVFDSLLYHQQNIRWNEEYPIVPGLGNIEHRFSFNSNYLLLSAIFSFRFLFGESVYSIQVLVLACIICWIIKDIIRSGYELRRLFLLITIIGYMFTFGYSLAATSTDAIPNIVSFYLIAMLLIYPDSLKNKKLLFVILPITLVTFKLAIMPLCLFSLYILVGLIRKRNYRTILFLIITSLVILLLWFIRNLIISGYIIFPLHEINIFSVDWKIPSFVAIEERDFIRSCGLRILDDILKAITNPELTPSGIYQWVMNLIFVGPVLISPFIVIYCLIKKRFLNKTIYLIYLVILATIGIWYTGGPDPRFIGGVLFAILYYIVYLLFSTSKEKYFPRCGLLLICSFSVLMVYWAISRSVKFYNMFDLGTPKANSRPVSDILIRQYPYRELLKSGGIYIDKFVPYTLENGCIIYISKSPEIPNGRFVCFEDPFPGTVLKADEYSKYQDISTIETRGDSFQDGFRPKD